VESSQKGYPYLVGSVAGTVAVVAGVPRKFRESLAFGARIQIHRLVSCLLRHFPWTSPAAFQLSFLHRTSSTYSCAEIGLVIGAWSWTWVLEATQWLAVDRIRVLGTSLLPVPGGPRLSRALSEAADGHARSLSVLHLVRDQARSRHSRHRPWRHLGLQPHRPGVAHPCAAGPLAKRPWTRKTGVYRWSGRPQ
jgi:hypothetical protein